MKPVTVTMPLALTPEMVVAVRDDPTTKAEDWETWHARLGWLICAWDVLLAARPNLGGDVVPVPREALEWLMGERGEFEPADAGLPQPHDYKRPQFWWRSEFMKRARLQRSSHHLHHQTQGTSMTAEALKAIKLAWATGETVQGRDTGEVTWCDWTNDISLDLAYWDEYRVKPKPIKVWVWANVYYDHISTHSRNTHTAAEKDRHNDLRLGSTCTEIVEVELEMPE